MRLVIIALALTGCVDASPAPLEVTVRAVWLRGADAERARMDDYFACLLGASNLESYWGSEAVVGYGGSRVVEPPEGHLGIFDVPGFVAALEPVPGQDARSVDIVFGAGDHLDLDGCAQLTTTVREGREVGVAAVQVTPVCWPGTEPLRNLTQLALQELVEVVDLMLGYAPCAGDGACQADGACPLGCDAFVGLQCPGAPQATYTGCGSQIIDGWVVQRLSHEGRLARNCLRCTTCDFVPSQR